MSRRETHITIQHPGDPGASRSNSFSEEEDSRQDSQEYSSSSADLDTWADYEDEIDPDDSASASNHKPFRPRPQRAPSRRHRLPHRQSYPYRPGPVPNAPASVEPLEEYGQPYGGGRGGYGPPPGPGGYYAARGGPPPGYPQSHAGGYMPGPYGPGNQMVPYNFSNPFTPMSNGSGGASYFGEHGRPPYDMMPYQQGYYGGHGYQVPPHMQQYMYNPPPPPPTEAPAPPKTPAPAEPAKLDPETIKLKEQLDIFKAEQAKKDAAEKQRELEDKIRRDTEDAIQRRMEDMRRAQEEAKKEIEKAKIDAERAAREKMEAEIKAEAERAKLHKETMARAEREAREKYEAELRAEAERKKREEEARTAAELAAKIKLEAAIKAEAEAKAAADKKAAEEADAKKRWEEDMKVKAELEARAKLEAEKKAAADAAEAADTKKKEEEAIKKQATEDAKAKFEEDSKTGKDKAPIKFKDAVGRKFSFPFHLCKTWQGMEELIKQAFMQVDVIGPHVQEGHYDLMGPNGEIILPSVWEKVIEPDWAVTMHMWPMDKAPLLGRGHRMPHMPHGMQDPRGIPAHIRMGMFPPGMRPPGMQQGGGGGGGGGRHGAPPAPPNWHGPRMNPPGGERPGRGAPPGIHVVDAEPKPKKKANGSVLSWMAGSKQPKKKGKK